MRMLQQELPGVQPSSAVGEQAAPAAAASGGKKFIDQYFGEFVFSSLLEATIS